MTIRFNDPDAVRDALVALSAAVAVGAQFTLSIDPAAGDDVKELLESTADFVPGLIHTAEETDAQLATRINQGHVNRIRLLASRRQTVIKAAAGAFVTVVNDPVLCDGRIECLRYLDEQSICYDYHRYGNLGRRVDEPRREVL